MGLSVWAILLGILLLAKVTVNIVGVLLRKAAKIAAFDALFLFIFVAFFSQKNY